MKHILIAGVVLAGMTTAMPAYAKHCPKDAAIVDAALAKAKGLSPMQMSEARKLRDEGMALHKSGKHAESIKALHKATTILGVEPYKPM